MCELTGHISFEIKMLKDFDEGGSIYYVRKFLGYRSPTGVNVINGLPLIKPVND